MARFAHWPVGHGAWLVVAAACAAFGLLSESCGIVSSNCEEVEKGIRWHPPFFHRSDQILRLFNMLNRGTGLVLFELKNRQPVEDLGGT